jgi:hypothetical protein
MLHSWIKPFIYMHENIGIVESTEKMLKLAKE